MKLLFCQKCGAQIPDDSRFCEACGEPVSIPQAQPEPAPPAQPEETQTFCTNCGAAIPAGSQFCEQCGARVAGAQEEKSLFCTNCGAKMVAGSQFCEQCGARLSRPEQTVFLRPGQNAAGAAAVAAKRRGFPAKLVVAAVILVLLAAAGIFAARKIGSALGGGAAERPIVYIMDGDTLRFSHSGMKEPATISASMNLDDLEVAFSHSNRELLYLNEDRSLYLRNVDRAKPSNPEKAEKGVKLASDVEAFRFTDDDKYILYKKLDGDLYCHDRKDSAKLDTQIDGFFRLMADRVVYGRDGNLYIQTVGSKKDTKQKIDSDAQLLNLSKDAKYVLYQKQDYTGGESLTEYYLYTVASGDKQKIGSGTASLLAFSENRDAVLYTDQTEQVYDLWDYIEDDQASHDAGIERPERNDYYQRQQGGGLFGATFDQEGFNRALEEYRQKESRDRLRERITQNPTFSIRGYDLYYGAGGRSSDKLATDVYTNFSEGFGIYGQSILYTTLERSEAKKIKLSELSNNLSPESLLQISAKATVYLMPISGGEPSALLSWNPAEEEIRDLRMLRDGSGMYYINDDDELYWVKINGGKAESPVKVDDDVSWMLYPGRNGIYDGSQSVYGAYEDGWQEKLPFLYFKDYEDSAGVLYQANGASKEKIADEVYGVPFARENTIIFPTDYNSSRGRGDYSIHTGGKAKKLGTDVSRVYYNNPSCVYLLKDYNSSSRRGDLYRYTGKAELELLDSGVSTVGW